MSVMIDQYYSILSSIFTPILVLPDPLALAALSILVTVGVTLIYKKFIDQTAMREVKSKVKTNYRF